MWTAVEQRHAQRILQALELTRQRGLRDLQQLGRPGDVALIGHRQEIPQHAQIHTRTDAPAIRVRGRLREIRRVLNTGRRCVHIHIHIHLPTFSTPTGPHARRADFQCNRPMSPERRRLVRLRRNSAGPGPAPVRSLTGKIGVRTVQRREHRGCIAHAAVCRRHIGARRADHLLWRHRPHVRARQRCADHAATMIRRYE